MAGAFTDQPHTAGQASTVPLCKDIRGVDCAEYGTQRNWGDERHFKGSRANVG